VGDDLGTLILKEVSRSFYPTLRLLPEGMRDAASLGYLLARAADTIADTAAMPAEERMGLLLAYADTVTGGAPLPQWPAGMLEVVPAGERRLLERAEDIVAWLGRIPEGEQVLVRGVVASIIGGQFKDLERFGSASAASPVALADAATLDDYTWCVAGCVGAFWTKLGFHALGPAYADMDEAFLLEKGIAYGKGLQLVNILRDLPEDIAVGRCYLPVADPLDRDELMASFRQWREQAELNIAGGIRYASSLRIRRLRAATVLPALIAEDTLKRLKDVSWETLSRRVKTPRIKVYQLLAKAFFF